MEVLPLKQRIIKDSDETSDTVYARGFSKLIPDDEVLNFLSVLHKPIEIDFSKRLQSSGTWFCVLILTTLLICLLFICFMQDKFGPNIQM